MKSNRNFLTKSKFKIGCECPTKLFYSSNSEFGNSNTENSFLEALAEGGFQVGELAKIYHQGGIEIETIDKDEAINQTNALLKNETAVIFEAAFGFENLFIRADIVVKNGKSLQLVEVKAKSFDPHSEERFYTKSSLKKGLCCPSSIVTKLEII